MKKIEFLEQMAKEKKYYEETQVNQTFGLAYFAARRNGNDLLDFGEVIWRRDVEQICENLEEFEIREFTISSTYSGLIEIIAEFDKKGWKVAGITEVNANYTDLTTGKLQIIPAFRMQRV